MCKVKLTLLTATGWPRTQPHLPAEVTEPKGLSHPQVKCTSLPSDDHTSESSNRTGNLKRKMKVHSFREQLQVMPQFILNTNEESSTAFSISHFSQRQTPPRATPVELKRTQSYSRKAEISLDTRLGCVTNSSSLSC